ncbi:hypothetical protein J19TS2_18470 [Cohnella xylanilytica]|uniref:lipid II:glycine glycyltransferase FemX n=1 Tax=Cohnella xylanilytica TaxID=557555 RepID=UPI001B1F015D|nr:GNAT family N-acetyltransferase [Cohnella xylanilytica]GIO12292.1 hypothetical protein J19TS2_18470 [Cohnella xylanilytica]
MQRLNITPFENEEEWNRIVRSFRAHDVYYLREYASAFRWANDGDPLLIHYQGNNMRLCYVVQQQDIADSAAFAGHLTPGTRLDWTTPYGYGGPITEGYDLQDLRDFFRQLTVYGRSRGVVTQFIRFHPLLRNHLSVEGFCELRNLKQTVYIDTSSLDAVRANLDPKNRNMIKKAIKNGINIDIDNSAEARDAFVEMYRKTMERNEASRYYYFNEPFFEDLFLNLEGHYSLFHARWEDRIVSSAIIMHHREYAHYHLSASEREAMHLAPNNLLLFRAAEWAAENGYKALHLGGGVDATDSLLSFKKSFNRRGLIDFFIGRTIFSEEMYGDLLRLRAKVDKNFNPDNNRLIQYRA